MAVAEVSEMARQVNSVEPGHGDSVGLIGSDQSGLGSGRIWFIRPNSITDGQINFNTRSVVDSNPIVNEFNSISFLRQPRTRP